MTQVIATLIRAVVTRLVALFKPAARKTVDGVMSAFQKSLDELEHVRATHLDLAFQHKTAIDEATAARALALTEATRAAAVHERISSIIA